MTAWIEANCVLPSGEHIGRPFRLMPWQKDWINELYACDPKGNLRYRWSLLGIPKKNGKSTMIAAPGRSAPPPPTARPTSSSTPRS